MKRTTRIIHDPYTPPKGFNAPQPGVFRASTVFFSSVKEMREHSWLDKNGYTYGLHGTPTIFTLEERIAHLEGGNYCMLAPSGLAAITLIDLAVLKTGDHVLLPNNVYGPSLEAARDLLQNFGISYTVYDPMHPESLQAGINKKTKLIWLEAPGSVTMEFPALDTLIQIAREAKVLTALDNTWAAGLAMCGFNVGKDAQGNEIGADFVMQALTKYPSGGGDVLMGSIVTRDKNLHKLIQIAHMNTGIAASPADAELVLRSLPTITLRYDAQYQQALTLAKWCEQRAEFTNVLFPALEQSLGHEHWKRLTNGTGAGLFSVIFDKRYSQDQVDRFVNSLQLFKMGYSWGGPTSLVVPYNLSEMRKTPTWQGALVRFSMGFEALEDLQADIEQALAKI